MTTLRLFLLLLITIVTSTVGVFAQTKKPGMSQKDIQKLMDEVKRKAASGEDSSEAELEAMMKKASAGVPAKQMQAAMKTTPKGSFPVLNAKVMASLPKQPLTTLELKNHVSNLYSRLAKNVSPTQVQAVQATATQLSNDADKMSQMAVAVYYKGAPQEAVLLAAKAALQAPEKDLNMNNLAALLTNEGASYQAIPILKTLVERYPNSAMVLNNLGQAYAGIGAVEEAKVYFGRCIQRAPLHPEANNTMAQIAKSQGNTAKAVEHAQKSLEGAYNEGAADIVQKLEPSKSLIEYLRTNTNFPDYFNMYKFKMPRHQENIFEAEEVRAEHAAFRQAMEAIESNLLNLARAEEKKGKARMEQLAQEMRKDPGKYAFMQDKLVRPYTWVGMKMLMEYGKDPKHVALAKEQDRYKARLKELATQYKVAIGSIRERYAAEMSKYDCGEGNGQGCAEQDKLARARCKEIDQKGNEYLKACAVAADEFYKKHLLYAREVFYYGSTWGYLAAPDRNLARAAYYDAAADYISTIKNIPTGVYVSPDCTPLDYVKKDDNSTANPEPACPIDISGSFLVGEFKVNCEEFEFEVEAGVKFGYKKNFQNRQSTLTIGAGLELGQGLESEIGKVEGKVEVGQSFFITFDGQNRMTDAGIKFGAGVSAGIEGGVGPITSSTDSEFEVGYTLGVNSGWSFEDGGLGEILAPTPAQINPNVGMYKK